MRCPECGRLMLVAFISDGDQLPVFQCATAGVPMFGLTKSGKPRQIGSTTDHTDRYFVRPSYNGSLIRVKPMKLGTSSRPATGGGKETFNTWGYSYVHVVRYAA